jgi:hypothetical protein
MTSLAERRIGQPVQGQQGAFDPPERAERPREDVTSTGRRELAQDATASIPNSRPQSERQLSRTLRRGSLQT